MTQRWGDQNCLHKLAGPLAGLVAAAIVVASPVLVTAQEHLSSDAAQKALKARKHQLEASRDRAKTLQQDVVAIRAERERINSRLLETAALIQKSEAQLTNIEARTSDLENQEKLIRGSLDQRHGQISKLFAALQRMGRNPPPVLFTQRKDALKMVRSAMMLAYAVPGLRKESLALAEQLNQLVAVMSEIRTEGERLRTETGRLKDAQVRLTGLMTEKRVSLASAQSELGAVESAQAEISSSVRDLSELIGKLDEAVTANTGLGEYEKKQQALAMAEPASQARAADPVAENLPPNSKIPAPPAAAVVLNAAPSKTPPPAVIEPRPAEVVAAPETVKIPPQSPPAAVESTAVASLQAASPDELGTATAAGGAAAPPASAASPPVPAPNVETPAAASPSSASPARDSRTAIVLAPSGGALALASPGRMEPAVPFIKARGSLPLPAQGRRVLAFNEKTQYGGSSKGIVFETRSNAQVIAPCDGWIVYAGEFRSYGKLLIINAGGGYHMLLAGLSQIDVKPGQFVLAAEPVGTMIGQSKAPVGQTSAAPVLYIELRKDGRPIDPDPWWSPIHQKVQG